MDVMVLETSEPKVEINKGMYEVVPRLLFPIWPLKL
jgi:hypothetical protein